MIDLIEFVSRVQTNAPSAPEPLIERAIVQAAIRFCERTRLWRRHDVISTDGDDAEQISVPPDSILYEVAACAMAPLGGSVPGLGGAIPLKPISLDELAAWRPNWRIEPIGCYGPRHYVCPWFGAIQAVPRSSGTLIVEFIAKPYHNAQTLPDFLHRLYQDDIATGASAIILSTPDKAFANPELAAALTNKFESRLGALSNAGERGEQRAISRTKARFL